MKVNGEQIRSMLRKAEIYLQSADDEFDTFRYGISSSQAYYCIFHAMSAALYSIELTFSKHSGVISGFSKHFLKTDIFDRQYGPIIQRLRKHREIGDYSYSEDIGLEESE